MEVENNIICHKPFATERICKSLENVDAETFLNKILRMSSARLFNAKMASNIVQS